MSFVPAQTPKQGALPQGDGAGRSEVRGSGKRKKQKRKIRAVAVKAIQAANNKLWTGHALQGKTQTRTFRDKPTGARGEPQVSVGTLGVHPSSPAASQKENPQGRLLPSLGTLNPALFAI